jgi:phosphatidylglycerophosphate synthase
MQIRMRLDGIPWAMAAGRALLGPVMIAGEKCGWNGVMLAWIVVTALVSDIFDGVLARRWGSDTAAVRLFDSMSDTVFYLCVAITIAVGRPEVWRANAGMLAALMGLEAVRLVVEFAKFGKPASYHSYLAKAWGLVMAVAVVGVFASPGVGLLLPLALGLGIACNVEGLAMTWMLPVWHRDVKSLWAAWRLRQELRGRVAVRQVVGNAGAMIAKTAAGGTALLALCLMAPHSAWAIEPGQAMYTGGTAAIAQDNMGVLDFASPKALVFRYKKPDGMPGELDVDYTKLNSFEYRNEVTHHLGVLPAIAVGLVAARQRRYFFSISYTDETGAAQVAIFEVAKRDQPAVMAVLHARSPTACRLAPGMYGEFNCRVAARPTVAK